MDPRKSAKSRKTNETDIRVSLNLDGTGEHRIATGIPFFDHMLAQIARHGRFDLYTGRSSKLHASAISRRN